MAKRVAPPKRTGDIRCAIYTRKSTEEGLEQEFNSLDAQREACAAYVLSQRHEGWTLVPAVYDDGGFSGGNMDRPGLKQLMADIAAGLVDVIVVYKVDRLTRSLADFAKIVEVLDGAGASFVSITQAFNTTTSMGRLTLNVLLSFAQFEREVTGERIRDKVAASKRKGMWMGGVVPLGYDVRERKLIVNAAEAATVRRVFDRYAVLKSIGDLAAELARDGTRSKRRVFANGDIYGDRTFSKGALAHLLQNRVYVGEIVHKGESFPGEHQPIVARDVFDEVQTTISGNRVAKRLQSRAEHPSLLSGMIVDGEGRRMTPSHATKGSRRYRYYVTAPDDSGRTSPNAWRIPAGEIEQLVLRRISGWLADGSAMIALASERWPKDIHRRVEQLANAAATILDGTAASRRQALLGGNMTLALSTGSIGVSIDPAALIGVEQGVGRFDLLTIDATLDRRGQELRIVLPPRELRQSGLTSSTWLTPSAAAISKSVTIVGLRRPCSRPLRYC